MAGVYKMSEVMSQNPAMAEPRVKRPATSQSPEVSRLAKGLGISLVGKIAGRGLHVLGQVALARFLGPEAFGLYAIGWTILRMAGLVSPLGLNRGVIRYASLYWRADASKLKGVLLHSLGLAALSGLLIGGILYLSAPWLAEHVFKKPDLLSVIRWLAPAFLFYAGLRVATAATTVSKRMIYSFYAFDLLQPASNLFLILVCYLVGWRLLGTVAAAVISFGLACILALYYVKQLFPEAFSSQIKSASVAKDLLLFSLPSSLAGVFTMFLIWVDRLMVSSFCPAAEVGIYNAASQSSIFFAIVLNAFDAIFSPMIADLHHKNDMKRLEELFRISTKWGVYISIPTFLTMCFAPKELMAFVFGARYESGWLPMLILAIGQMINIGTGSIGQLLVMTGNQKRWFTSSGSMLFTNIALLWIFIPRWGLAGAAFATACALGGLFFLGLMQVKNILGLWPYDTRYLKGLLATCITVAVLMLLHFAKVASPVLHLAITLATSVGVFGATLLLLGLDSEDKEFFHVMRARLSRLRN
jgi:O-antigen/teichoic acid export membrane protein